MKAIHNLFLVAWDNGVLMLAVFCGVVLALIGAVLMLMNSDKKP